MSIFTCFQHLKRRGMILITALWILGLLAFLSLNIIYRVRLEMALTSYKQDQLKGDALLRAGLARALWAIRQDTEIEVDSGADAWSNASDLAKEALLLSEYANADSVNVLWSVHDESGKININSAPQKVLDLLLKNLYGSSNDHQALAQYITDWIDKNDLGNAERDYYLSLNTPYVPRNDAIKDLRELLAVRDVTRELFEGEDANGNGILDASEDDGPIRLPNDNQDGEMQLGLQSVLTTQGDGHLNVNTAPVIVLESLFGAITTIDAAEAHSLAQLIDMNRCGPDGLIGTEDDVPFSDTHAIARVLQEETEIDILAQCRDNLNLPLDVCSAAFCIDVYVDFKDEAKELHGRGLVLREENQVKLGWWRTSR